MLLCSTGTGDRSCFCHRALLHTAAARVPALVQRSGRSALRSPPPGRPGRRLAGRFRQQPHYHNRDLANLFGAECSRTNQSLQSTISTPNSLMHIVKQALASPLEG